MPKIDIAAAPEKRGSDYPAPYDAPLAGRVVHRVSEGGGLNDFVANHVVLPPGCPSSQRHWHEGEDELLVVLAGEAVLIDDTGRHPMRAGEIAAFPKGDGNGHHLVNESDAECVLLAISLPEASRVHYPDIDLIWSPEEGDLHRDGMPYRRD
ncbi:MAG: cupin domain-containing protein [Sphingomonas sp.]